MTRPHLGAEAMTAPNDVAALVEREAKSISETNLDQYDKWHADRGVETSRAHWKRRALAAEAQVAALQAEVERAKEDSARLDWLERNRNAELAHEGWEDDVWQVHTVNGGRNDREWTLRAEGQTVREAIDAARSASRKENTP